MSGSYPVKVDEARKDFFISYNSANSDWAEWIGHVLEEGGYSVVIQAWDFRPGSNFVLEVQRALRECERMIAVLSPAYLQARYPQPEWAASFAGDPEGAKRALVPVMVQRCEPDALLGQVVHIPLFDLDDAAAARRLLDGVKVDRAKPTARPSFPGTGRGRSGDSSPKPARPDRLAWQRLPSPVNVVWRMELDDRFPNQHGYEAVELHLVPIGDDARLQVREIADLRDVLPEHGRLHKLFSSLEPLDASADATKARVTSKEREKVAGIAVTRSGQRSAWTALPRGAIGALLDEDHLIGQLQHLLDVLVSLPVPTPALVVPTAGFEPATMVSVGKVGVASNTASFGHGMPQHVRPVAEDALDFPQIALFAHEISTELAARLVAEHRIAARLL